MHSRTPWIALTLTLVALTSVGAVAAAGAHDESDRGAMSQPGDIVDTAVAAGSFDTLVAAVKAAGLVDALKGDGPFTVFAPTDAAFAKLPDGTVDSLLRPENREQLVAILTYHVVPGRVLSDQVRPGQAATLQGASVTFSQNHGSLMINQATIIDTDIVTTNGVIHVIDEVIMPPQPRAAGPAEKLIRLAIMRGAPLFNDDQPAACTAVYEVVARGLLGADGYGLDDHARARLERALSDIERTHDARRQAWIMRDALDDVLAALVGTERRMPVMSRR